MKCKHWSIWSHSSCQMCVSSCSPHPRYNELDAVSCLEERLSPNRLWGLEALREGRDTNLSPVYAQWEFCFICTDAAETPLHANSAQAPFPQEYVGPGDTADPPVRASASWERVLLFQRKTFNNHALAQGQLSSADQGDGASGEENVLTSALGKLSDIYSLPT